MLVREQPATDLTIATRILARSGALVGDRRITLRLRDVMYIGGRDVELSTMTPYDVAVVLSSDGSTLHGQAPSDIADYLEVHRRSPHIASVARMSDGDYVCAPTLRGCVVAALGPSVARQPRKVRAAFTGELKDAVDFLAALVPGNDPSRRHEDALAAFACMIGALILARAVDDRRLSGQILDAAAKRVIRGQRRGK